MNQQNALSYKKKMKRMEFIRASNEGTEVEISKIGLNKHKNSPFNIKIIRETQKLFQLDS